MDTKAPHADAHGYVDLAAHGEFRALWIGNALGVAAGTVASLSLGTLVYAESGSPLFAAATMFGPSLVQLVGASTLMSAADTVRPRRALTWVGAAMAVGTAVQAAFSLPSPVRLLVALAAAFVMSIGGGVRWGLLAQVLPPSRYALGRSAMNVSVGVMQVLGFAVGGALLSLLSVGQVLWVAAALAALAVPITWSGVDDRPPRRSGRTGIRETWLGNRTLLAQPSTRTLLVALTVPNGLVAGCEALFVPYAGESAAALFVAGAGGMLVGDVTMGRVLNGSQRRAAATWLRWWLALPFVLFVLHPGTPVSAILVGLACLGYAATLAQQEVLVELVPPGLSGQVLGAESAARATCQGLSALLAGATAEVLDPGHAIAVLAASSLLVSATLTRSLVPATQTRPVDPSTVGTKMITTTRRF